MSWKEVLLIQMKAVDLRHIENALEQFKRALGGEGADVKLMSDETGRFRITVSDAARKVLVVHDGYEWGT